MDSLQVLSYVLVVFVLALGGVLVIWPRRMQQYVLKMPGAKFHPFYRWMESKSYVWALRVLGVCSLIVASIFLAVLVYSDLT